MSKPFLNLLNKDKDRNLSLSEKNTEKKVRDKSRPMIIFGFILSLTSIFLLLFTINNKFG